MSETPTLHSGSGEPSEHHVDVVEAEARFNELSRQLTLRSQGSPSETEADFKKDIEKGEAERETGFDLREYLSSSNDANQAAGIKHKHVGVTWEDLEVEVAGGIGFKVRYLYMQPLKHDGSRLNGTIS